MAHRFLIPLIVSSLALAACETPAKAPPATRTPSPTVTATAAPSAEPEPSPGETPAEVPAAPEAQEGNSATGWLVAAGIVVLGLAGWGAVLYARRNRAGG